MGAVGKTLGKTGRDKSKPLKTKGKGSKFSKKTVGGEPSGSKGKKKSDKKQAVSTLKDTGAGEDGDASKIVYEPEATGEDDHEFFDEEENQDYARFMLSLEASQLTVFGKKSSRKEAPAAARPKAPTPGASSATALSPATTSKPPPKSVAAPVEVKRRNASTAGWTEKDVWPQRLPIKTKEGVLKPNERMLQETTRGSRAQADDSGRGSGSGSESASPAADGDIGRGSRESGVSDGDSDSVYDSEASDVDMQDASMDGMREGTSEAKDRGGGPDGGIASAMVKVDLPVLTERRYQQQKLLIAELCEAILKAPDEALARPKAATGKETRSKMEELHELTEDNDRRVCHLALLSEYAIFKDIIPGYRIRVPSAAEMAQKVSKEVHRVRTHESALLKAYQAHLKVLEGAVLAVGAVAAPGRRPADRDQGSSRGRGSGASKGMVEARQARALGVAAVGCMCGLLLAHPHFNFRANLIRVVVVGTNHHLLEIREACSRCLERVFRGDLQGEVSLEVTKAVSKFIKDRKFKVSECTLRCLLGLPLRAREDDRAQAKAHMRRKRSKRRKEGSAEAGLAEADARADEDLLVKCQADSLHEVMLTYFRVIKRRPPPPALFPAVMEGLAKFVHLVNLDTVRDLLDLLKDLLDVEDNGEAKLPLRAALHCTLAAFRSLQGPGRELQTDEGAFVAALYRRMPELLLEPALGGSGGSGIGVKARGEGGRETSCVQLACDCLDIALLKRRELSMARVTAIIKRLLSLSLHLPQSPGSTPGPAPSTSLLRMAHCLLLRYPASRQLLENEHDRPGSGPYHPTLGDPEHANALSSAAWELSLLRHSAWPGTGARVRDTAALTTQEAAAALSAMHAREKEMREEEAEAGRGAGVAGVVAGTFAGVPAPEGRAIAGGRRVVEAEGGVVGGGEEEAAEMPKRGHHGKGGRAARGKRKLLPKDCGDLSSPLLLRLAQCEQ